MLGDSSGMKQRSSDIRFSHWEQMVSPGKAPSSLPLCISSSVLLMGRASFPQTEKGKEREFGSDDCYQNFQSNISIKLTNTLHEKSI